MTSVSPGSSSTSSKVSASGASCAVSSVAASIEAPRFVTGPCYRRWSPGPAVAVSAWRPCPARSCRPSDAASAAVADVSVDRGQRCGRDAGGRWAGVWCSAAQPCGCGRTGTPCRRLGRLGRVRLGRLGVLRLGRLGVRCCGATGVVGHRGVRAPWSADFGCWSCAAVWPLARPMAASSARDPAPRWRCVHRSSGRSSWRGRSRSPASVASAPARSPWAIWARVPTSLWFMLATRAAWTRSSSWCRCRRHDGRRRSPCTATSGSPVMAAATPLTDKSAPSDDCDRGGPQAVSTAPAGRARPARTGPWPGRRVPRPGRWARRQSARREPLVDLGGERGQHRADRVVVAGTCGPSGQLVEQLGVRATATRFSRRPTHPG